MKESRVIIFLLILNLVAFRTYSQDISYNDKEVKEALIYPNPLVGEKFMVKSESEIAKIEVVNVIGKVISRTENHNFELNELQVFVGKCEKGIYFVKITFVDKKSIVKKLLVK